MVTTLLNRTKYLSPLKRGSLFYLTFFGVIGMFLPFLNLYYRQELGFSGRQIALLAMLPPIIMLTVAVPLASLADRRSWRIPIVMIMLLGGSIMMVVAQYSQTFLAWILVRFGMALFLSPTMPLADSLIARMSSRHDLNYGTMRLCGSISFALAAFACGMLWERFGFRVMFFAVAVALLPALFFASRLDEIQTVTADQRVKLSFEEIIQDRGLLILLLTSFFVGTSFTMSIVFDGIYMASLGGTEALVGIMFSLAAWGELPTMQYRDRLARYLSGPTTLLLSYGLLLTAFLGYVLAWHPRVLLGMAFVKGLGFGLFLVSVVKLVNERVPESWSSTVQSLLTASMFGLAPLVSAPVGGELLDRFGPKAVFVGSSLGVTIAIVLLAFAMFKGILKDVVLEKEKT